MSFCQSAYIFVSQYLFPFVRIDTHSLCLLKSSFTQVTAKHVFHLIYSDLRPCIVFVWHAQVLQYSTQMEFYFFTLKVSIKICEIEMKWNCSTPGCCGQSMNFLSLKGILKKYVILFHYFKSMSVWNAPSWMDTEEVKDATGESFMDIMKLYSVFLGPVVLVRDCYSRPTIQYTGPAEFVTMQTLWTRSASAARVLEKQGLFRELYILFLAQPARSWLLFYRAFFTCATYLCTQNWTAVFIHVHTEIWVWKILHLNTQSNVSQSYQSKCGVLNKMLMLTLVVILVWHVSTS